MQTALGHPLRRNASSLQTMTRFFLSHNQTSKSSDCSLVHCGLLAAGSPHPSASRPPSPQGKALRCTVYHKKVQHFKFVPRRQSLPRGGRWAGQSPGRMRATYRTESVVYQPNHAPCGTPNPIHPPKADSIADLPSPQVGFLAKRKHAATVRVEPPATCLFFDILFFQPGEQPPRHLQFSRGHRA